MNKRLLLATAATFVLAAGAFAQSPDSTSQKDPATNQPAAQNRTNPAPTTTAPATGQSTSGQTTAPNTSTQNQPPASSNTNTSQSAAPNTGAATSQAPASNNAPAQAQSTTPQGSSAQTANPPPSTNNQAQQNPNAPGSSTNTAQQPSTTTAQQPAQQPGTTNTAQQPSTQSNTAQTSSSTNVNASVNINDQQRTRISQSVARLNVQPLTNVNFSLSVGTAIPRDVRLSPLPADVVEIVPQYRGYNFVLVRDEIVIVDPQSSKIVAVLPHSGHSTATAPAPKEQRKATFSDRDREAVRKHVRSRSTEGRTTGSSARTEIRTGERVPDSVEIEAFPEEVYRESPALREYRYIHRERRTYVIEPGERRVIEEID